MKSDTWTAWTSDAQRRARLIPTLIYLTTSAICVVIAVWLLLDGDWAEPTRARNVAGLFLFLSLSCLVAARVGRRR